MKLAVRFNVNLFYCIKYLLPCFGIWIQDIFPHIFLCDELELIRLIINFTEWLRLWGFLIEFEDKGKNSEGFWRVFDGYWRDSLPFNGECMYDTFRGIYIIQKYCKIFYLHKRLFIGEYVVFSGNYLKLFDNSRA